ncbi:MAG: bifunctional UDP-sugar hydrolase/5'-nucleotidase [Candidatus Eisenbacteria bacterium]
MNRIGILITLLFLPGWAGAGGGTVTIFHTNDLHGAFTAEPASWRDDKAPVGGFEAIAGTIRRERANSAASLWLDAGDFMTGTPLSDIEHGGAKGGAIVEFYNRAGLDAMTIGNHEFDQSLENLRALIAAAEFPVLAANLSYTLGGSLFTGKAYEIFETGGIRVAVIGITTEELAGLVSADKRDVLSIAGGAETLRALLPEVDGKSDLVVVLSHEGIDIDRVLAREVEGIDVIVGGHSHTRLPEGEWVNGVLILQAGSEGRYIGRADLVVENDALASADCRLVPALAGEAEPDGAIRELVRGYEKKIDEQFGAVIAEAPRPLGRCYYCESDLGNWLTDRMREFAGTDIALLNSGGIRQDMDAGPVTKLDIQGILPFTNMLCRFTATGEEIAAIALHNARAEATEDHGILQISGLTYSWYRQGDDVKTHVVLVGGRLLDPKATYSVASVDFVARSQADKYLGITPETVEDLGATLTSVIMKEAERLGRVELEPDDRVQRVEIDYAAPRR